MDRIYKITAPAWQNDPDLPDYFPFPPQTALIAVNGTDEAYLVGEGGIADWDALTAVIVGSWDSVTGLQEGQSFDVDGTTVIGTPTFPVTADYADWIRPLGNDDGRATGLLDSTRWAGHSEPKYLQDANRYPDTNAPFQLKIYREEIVAPDPFPGWGWSVEMISADPERDITARAVGVYSDPECTAFLYTTGAFIQDGTHDNNFYTECPAGERKPAPEQINFALLQGSLQEGFFNLPVGTDLTDALFWEKNQPEPGEEWQSGVAYSIDDEVTYLGILYICIQAHTSQPGWEPPNVPALWAVV